ncbi:MAG TPA: right-handed parallel beta-helix repeat-containing protein [Solirubrobacterales bacterium]|jgi:hypothetical protein|nr:right-handed parallel beta-helix repeat-containing protein [Solirubrobacterales bacterium]
MAHRPRSPGLPAAKVAVALAAICAAILALLVAAPSPSPAAPAATGCDATVGSLDAARSRVDAASPGKVICLRDGSYGSISLGGGKKGAPVTLRPVDAGQATIEGANLSGSHLTLENFQIHGEVEIEPHADQITISHNNITGGYFGIDACNSDSATCDDVAIIGNKLEGPYGEDAIRANRYHDANGDGIGLLIEGNEFTGIRENGNHSDCLQTVWTGDHLVYRKNYVHDNHCQGFFVKDQDDLCGGDSSGVCGPVEGIRVEDNLFLRNEAPCDPPSLDCGPDVIVHIFGPTRGVRVAKNTIWTPGDDSPLALREGPFGQVTIERNVIYRGWTDWTGGFPNWREREDVVCKWEGYPRLSPSSKRTCHPGFRKPSVDDYRLRKGKAGIDWSPTQVRYGPR